MLLRARRQSDAEVVRAVRAGRTQRFEVLVDRYQNLVYSLILSSLRNGGDAEDLAQEAFLRAFEQLPSLDDPLLFAPWWWWTPVTGKG